MDRFVVGVVGPKERKKGGCQGQQHAVKQTQYRKRCPNFIPIS